MKSEAFLQKWYVLHTKSRFENVVHEGLLKKSLEVFLPKIQVQSRRRDRKCVIRVPLFPGYVFVKTDLNPYEHLEIVKTTGAVRLIGGKAGPVSVPEDTVTSLQIMVSGNLPIATGSRLKKGDRVMVVSGPFTGVTGVFSRYKGQGRVVVNIEALGQFAALEVDENDLEKIPDLLP